jgi:DNA-binding beta-propeller fold protein YncE
MKRNLLIAAIATAIIAAPATATVLLKTGALEQLPGKKGCLAGSNSGCARARAVTRVTNLIVSADGKNVYVSGGVGANSQIAAFKRKTTNGLLSQLKGKNGCVLFAGYGGGKVCALGRSIDTPSTPALSPDGKNLYVAATHSLAVDVFKRTPSTGALTQLAGTAGCLSLQGTGGACTVAPGLDQAAAVAVSPDGAHVYVAGSGIAAFARDATTGALTQLAGTGGCINSDGSAPCAIANGLSQLRAIAISSDGKSVYVGGGGGKHGSLAAFERDAATGALTQLAGAQGCYSQAGEDVNCTPAVALQQVSSMVLSPGGEKLYVASAVSSGVRQGPRARQRRLDRDQSRRKDGLRRCGQLEAGRSRRLCP